MSQYRWRVVVTSDGVGATCVQGECDAADGWGPPHPWAHRSALQNDGVAAGGEIQQVNNGP